MRLDEVDSSSSDLVLLLRNLVSQANSQQQTSYLSWSALNNLMQNVGKEQFDYDSFKKSYDTNPIVQNLVHKFDAKGIELKTQKTTPKKAETGEKESSISKMAKSATKRRLGK